MMHSFDTDIAEKYGVNSAVLLNNIYFWIEKNRANEKNFFDGHYWTYNSVKAFKELFPYLTPRAISTALAKLIDDGILITGNYNAIAYDRTLWYALTEKGYSIIQKCKMEIAEMQNGNGENVEPIPDNKPDVKPVINKDNKESKQESGKAQSKNKNSFDKILTDYTDNKETLELLGEWLKVRKAKRAAMTDRSISMNIAKLDKLAAESKMSVNTYLEEIICKGWAAFYPIANYSNNRQDNKTYGKTGVEIIKNDDDDLAGIL